MPVSGLFRENRGPEFKRSRPYRQRSIHQENPILQPGMEAMG